MFQRYADVSVVDLTVKLAKETTYEEIMKVLKNASETSMKGILGYTEDLVVSQDFVSDTQNFNCRCKSRNWFKFNIFSN